MILITDENGSHLNALQKATSLYYYDESDMPVAVLWVIAATMRAMVTGEGVTEALKAWKTALTYEIETSRFVSSFEIKELTTILENV